MRQLLRILAVDVVGIHWGNADVDFARSMMKHHEGGIVMAQASTEVRQRPGAAQKADKLIKKQSQDKKKLQA